MDAKRNNTAKIRDDLFCKECGWPVVDACCNNNFTNFKDAGDWDWWLYCSNKGCINHDGEGIFQGLPQWVFRD